MNLPDNFSVQIIFNNDLINELDAQRPSDEMLASIRNENTLIKLKFSDSNKIVLPRSFIQVGTEKRKPGRPPKVKEEDDDIDEIDEEGGDEDEMEIEDDEMIENENLMESSDRLDRKLTKRQMNASSDQLLQLPDKRGKNRKNVIMTEEEVSKRNIKEVERKVKLLQQQEEQKQQTVDRILNEVGRKQKQRQELEEKNTNEKKQHNYRSLPAGDLIIKYKSTSQGQTLSTPYIITPADLYVQQPLSYPKTKPQCSKCSNISKYKIPNSALNACSLGCFKLLQAN